MYIVIGMNTDPFIFSFDICLNRFTSNSSSSKTCVN